MLRFFFICLYLQVHTNEMDVQFTFFSILRLNQYNKYYIFAFKSFFFFTCLKLYVIFKKTNEKVLKSANIAKLDRAPAEK